MSVYEKAKTTIQISATVKVVKTFELLVKGNYNEVYNH